MCHNPLDWDKKLRGFFSDAKCLILNVPARMAYPPDRIVIDYPTHLDPLVAVSVRGIFAIGR